MTQDEFVVWSDLMSQSCLEDQTTVLDVTCWAMSSRMDSSLIQRE